MTQLPAQYAWLAKEPGPKMLVEALKEYGTVETSGPKDNPKILQWAHEIGITWYLHDSIPWCGLFMGVVAHRAGKQLPHDPLRALAWSTFGARHVDPPMLGDVLSFKRTGGGHVGMYVGEDDQCFHVLGGNQGDCVSIKRIQRVRLYAARRPAYSVGQPPNVRVVKLSKTGAVSTNEA